MGIPFWPNGDPDQIRAAASAWRQRATTLEAWGAQANAAVEGLNAHWQGPAAQQFQTAWGKYHSHFADAVTEHRKVADQLETIADKIAKAQSDAEHALIIAGASMVIVAVLTFGIGTAVTGATELGALATILAYLGSSLVDVTVALGVSSTLLASIADAFTVFFSIDFADRYAKAEWDGEHFTPAKAAELSAVTAALSTTFLIGGASALYGAGKLVTIAGGAGLGMANSATGQAILEEIGTRGDFTWDQVFMSGALGGGMGAVPLDGGEHVDTVDPGTSMQAPTAGADTLGPSGGATAKTSIAGAETVDPSGGTVVKAPIGSGDHVTGSAPMTSSSAKKVDIPGLKDSAAVRVDG